jgi:hypothetical protein
MSPDMQRQLEEEFGPFGGEEESSQLKEPPRPEEQRRVLEEMRMSSTRRRRRNAMEASRGYESRAKDIMFDLIEDASAPWEQMSTTELAETAADVLGHDEWLDDPDHPIWDWALEVIDYRDEGYVDEDLMY